MSNGNFCERLKETMHDRGFSGRKLAESSGTTEATVSRYLSGARRPEALEVLSGIAKTLAVSSDYLLGLTNNPFSKGSLPTEIKDLLTLYLRASNSDKKILWTVLEKYKTDRTE